ncbi:MAG: hypothetical protein EOO11_17175 [Chitinophagaceae bacterium]|nr:MAG: hypothetical protein EOO11_17175 [Chitinophagaceae bacterium]
MKSFPTIRKPRSLPHPIDLVKEEFTLERRGPYFYLAPGLFVHGDHFCALLRRAADVVEFEEWLPQRVID